jgi:hypothetical protein
MVRFAKVATASAALLCLTAGGSAAAQSSAPPPNEDSQASQEQADNDRPGAEDGRTATEALEAGQQMSGGSFARGSSARYVGTVPHGTNDFAVLKVPTYVLPNGVRIQVSGEFSPGEGVTCRSLCPAGFAR